MTMWNPEVPSGGPRYLAIADALARDVASGALPPGTKLPTHRDLARRLGVTVGTVTRAYAQAEQRGIIVGEVGRGTFVRSREVDGFGRPLAGEEQARSPGLLDLSISCPWIPPGGEEGRLLARTLQEIASEGLPDDLLAFEASTGLSRHRAIAAEWLRGLGVETTPEQVVVTNGAQHAIFVLLASLLRPGATLAVAELVYPGLRAAARALGLKLRAVELDGEGIVPESLEEVCDDGSVRALYCVPTLQNPTSATMSGERRRAVAEVCRRLDLFVLEDEIHAPIQDDGIPPLAAFAPERTLYIAALSKWATYSLRIGFVACPEDLVERVRAGVRMSCWMPAPLMTEVATRWLHDGTAAHLGELKRAEIEARHEIAREVLSGVDVRTGPRSLNLWVPLPEPLRPDECVELARQRGLLVAGADVFAVGRHVPPAVRVSLSNVSRREELRRGLQILREILDALPSACPRIL